MVEKGMMCVCVCVCFFRKFQIDKNEEKKKSPTIIESKLVPDILNISHLFYAIAHNSTNPKFNSKCAINWKWEWFIDGDVLYNFFSIIIFFQNAIKSI